MTDKIIPAEDEITCFRALMDGVQRLKTDRVIPEPPKPPPHPVQTWKDDASVMEKILHYPHDTEELQLGDAINYNRPGIQNAVLRKLRKGQYRIGAEIDLHGMSAVVALEALTRFLRQAQNSSSRCVRVIHGKGHRSSNHGPVLKPLVCKWLSKRDEVLAFSSARPMDGGTGALYVLLRRK